MRKVEKQVKRPRVNWYEVLKSVEDPRLDAEFYATWSKLGFGSKSRSAYNVLKKHYSTTSLLRVRWCGDQL